jgi:hypothetical protein
VNPQLTLAGIIPPDAHARAVWRGEYTPGWELTGLQRVVLGRLLNRLGAHNAMPLRELLLITGSDAREIKDAIRSLVVDFKVRVGASRGDTPGYYLITSSDEARTTVQPYISEIRQLVRRIRVLLDPHDMAELAGQLLLEDHPDSGPKEAA